MYVFGEPIMQEREVGFLLESGDLNGVAISHQSADQGWVITLTTKTDVAKHTLVTKREKTHRLFRTSDAALRWCKKLGINEVTVYL